MSCDICGRESCTEAFHSLEEQERFSVVIDAFDRARELRSKVWREYEAELDADAEDRADAASTLTEEPK